MRKTEHTALYWLSSKTFKGFLFLLVGLGSALLLSATLGAFDITQLLISFLGKWLWRISICLVWMIAITAIYEAVE
jgi:hypothetical protein